MPTPIRPCRMSFMFIRSSPLTISGEPSLKLFRLMLCALLASLLCGMVEGAKAQLGLTAAHRADSEDLLAATPTDPNKPQAVSGNKRYGSIGVYPFAGF